MSPADRAMRDDLAGRIPALTFSDGLEALRALRAVDRCADATRGIHLGTLEMIVRRGEKVVAGLDRAARSLVHIHGAQAGRGLVTPLQKVSF